MRTGKKFVRPARASEPCPEPLGAGVPVPPGRRYLLGVGILIAATAAAHGWALWDGTFLDDHLHLARLNDNHWSLRGLLEATTVKPDEFIDTWWQQRSIEWRYTRPVAKLAAKVVYHLSDGSVKALHAVSLLVHAVLAIMVFHLCLRLGRRWFWALVGGLLFVVYSHSVYAVAWLAAQNIVLQTAFTLGALLVYARASGLDLYAARDVDPDGGSATALPALNPGWFALAVVLWVMALLCRENAIVLPVFAAALDLAFGGRRHLLARWRPMLLMGVVGGAFLVLRLGYLYHPLPDFYLRRPDGPEYVLWWLAKLMHYVTAAVWLSPMTIGPTGRFNPFSEVPGDCLLMMGILGVMGTGYYLACRGARGYWIWPLWILLSMLPVVPVMAAPHSGYMAGIGFAVAMVIGPALRHRIKPVSIGRWCTVVAMWFLIATITYVPIYRTMWQSMLAAERLTVKSVAADPPPAEAEHVFFINLPFVNIYAQLHLGQVLDDFAWPPETLWASSEGEARVFSSEGRRLRHRIYAGPVLEAPRCHVLTYAPDLLRMDQPSRLEQIDAHTFRLSVEGRPYFSGALGRFLIESMRPEGRLQAGDEVVTELFSARIARADEEGVREIVFRFHEPLASSRFCFYISTNHNGAARVKFREFPPGLTEAEGDTPPAVEDKLVGQLPAGYLPTLVEIDSAALRLEAGDAAAAAVLIAGLSSPDAAIQSAAWKGFAQVAAPTAAALAAPVQDLLEMPLPPDGADAARLGQWWFHSIDDETLNALWVRRHDFVDLRRTRETLYWIRGIASRVIQTDLYLTGPPFPGPR